MYALEIGNSVSRIVIINNELDTNVDTNGNSNGDRSEEAFSCIVDKSLEQMVAIVGAI